MPAREIPFIDSHTAGEPTRVVWEGVDLGLGPLSERLARLQTEHDWFRSAVVNEPRGSDVLVGALLCEPSDPMCSFGVIFFNNVGYLGMCGHGTIGVIATMAWQRQLSPGAYRIETPVGVVTAILHEGGCVSIQNVPSYRKAKDVRVTVAGLGDVTGDVAWGGNWFFLVEQPLVALELTNVGRLTEVTARILEAVNGAGYPEVDHLELFSPSPGGLAHSRNFVLCPGKAYDRSPCGTGTSAKLACLAADGKLHSAESWIQESILGTTFHAQFQWEDEARGIIRPTITGTAHVTGSGKLIFSEGDPFLHGIRPSTATYSA